MWRSSKGEEAQPRGAGSTFGSPRTRRFVTHSDFVLCGPSLQRASRAEACHCWVMQLSYQCMTGRSFAGRLRGRPRSQGVWVECGSCPGRGEEPACPAGESGPSALRHHVAPPRATALSDQKTATQGPLRRERARRPWLAHGLSWRWSPSRASPLSPPPTSVTPSSATATTTAPARVRGLRTPMALEKGGVNFVSMSHNERPLSSSRPLRRDECVQGPGGRHRQALHVRAGAAEGDFREQIIFFPPCLGRRPRASSDDPLAPLARRSPLLPPTSCQLPCPRRTRRRSSLVRNRKSDVNANALASDACRGARCCATMPTRPVLCPVRSRLEKLCVTEIYAAHWAFRDTSLNCTAAQRIS